MCAAGQVLVGGVAVCGWVRWHADRLRTRVQLRVSV